MHISHPFGKFVLNLPEHGQTHKYEKCPYKRNRTKNVKGNKYLKKSPHPNAGDGMQEMSTMTAASPDIRLCFLDFELHRGRAKIPWGQNCALNYLVSGN